MAERPEDSDKENTSSPQGEGARRDEEAEDSCRCKESRGKTLGGMLRLMLKDIAFWRRRP